MKCKSAAISDNSLPTVVLVMTEFDFFCYSLFVQDDRGYNKNWAFVIFKVRYGKWLSKSLRLEATPKKPSDEYLTWLYNYFEQNLDSFK